MSNERLPFENWSIHPGGHGLPPRDVYRNVKLVIFDVDGVLTDARIILDSKGAESKFFDVRDGAGISFLIHAGLDVALLTGRSSPLVDARARELHIPPERVKQGAKVKLPVFQQLLAKEGLSASQVAYMGDDIVDLPLLQLAAIACCPGDAHPEVLKASHVVADPPGGRGAARCICEHLLKSREDGLWEKAINRYLGQA